MAGFDGFKKQLLELEPGNRLAYHIGNLGADRQQFSTVNKIAIVVQGLLLMGSVLLTTERLDRSKTAYFVNLSAHAARRLQPKDIVRAWTLGQEEHVEQQAKMKR